MAAELAGCGQMRIIFTHLVPSFLSHIIAATTLAIPAMIISETSLSFLAWGCGRRPSVGGSCCNRRRTSRPWRSRPGC